MVEFSKLRLTGFKSFVEPTEININAGMTGIVGPNGCGKSNVVEALRWVMGESSAKRLRGDDMDDVIFSGTSNRPSRNFAEAKLILKTAGSKLASRFPDTDELVISRRIDRGSGSTFRINGKETRASDVKLLFSDIASGAQSASIVAQGRVASLIDAKPTDRRIFLEEAAGTTGLAGRRKEAETRLKASEQNLTRVGDLNNALHEQLKVLENQSIGAEKYRTLSDQIRELEALQNLAAYHQQTRNVERGRERSQKLTIKLADVQGDVTGMTASVTSAATVLPALRTQDAETGAKFQRLIVERENLDREAQRVADAIEENKRGNEQLVQDMQREEILAKDAKQALEKLTAEEAELSTQKEASDETIEKWTQSVEQYRDQVSDSEEAVSQLNSELAKIDAEAMSHRKISTEANARVDRLQNRRDQVAQECDAVIKELSRGPNLDDLKENHARTIEAVVKAKNAAAATQKELDAKFQAERSLRDRLRQSENAHNSIRNEHKALTKITQKSQDGTFQANLMSSGSVNAEVGYEQALASVLGSGVIAVIGEVLSEKNPAVWTVLGSDTTQAHDLDLGWPNNIEPLANHVTAPKELSRLLNLCGVADDIATAMSCQHGLQRGQILTSKQGGLWRWDGFASLPGAEERAAAERLVQVKRLDELTLELNQSKQELEDAQRSFDAALEQRKSVDLAKNQANHALDTTTRTERDAETALLRAEKELGGLIAKRDNLDARLKETQTELLQAEKERDSLPSHSGHEDDRETLVNKLDTAKQDLAAKRVILNDASATLEQHRRAAATREARLGQILTERHDWEGRQQNADHYQQSLVERQQTLKQASERLQAMPAQFAEQKNKLDDAILTAKADKQSVSDALAVAEAEDRNRQVELRALENKANELSQELAVITASLETDEERLREIIEEIRTNFSCGPQGLYEKANFERGLPMPNKSDIERKLKNRIKDRDGLGPVNLRAEIERDAMVEKLDTLTRETAELEAAIAKLRASIMEINKEGRQRLSEAFETVNEAFKECFTKLFGGGKAELRLIDDKDDPLNSGLEIFAQPPGKRVTSLSLMSGGERSLAAIALIFALFRSNPAPICVLDEVDAPLDDHNVGRFVDLVRDMANELGTRFLVVTHHAITMAKMDRLYGVTMGEPGISNAYSVDLKSTELALAS